MIVSKAIVSKAIVLIVKGDIISSVKGDSTNPAILRVLLDSANGDSISLG
jgi:hypothetical protein